MTTVVIILMRCPLSVVSRSSHEQLATIFIDCYNGINNLDNSDSDNCFERRNSRLLTVSSLSHQLSSTSTLLWPAPSHVQITCSALGATFCHHVVQRDSSAISFHRVEIAYIWFFSLPKIINR